MPGRSRSSSVHVRSLLQRVLSRKLTSRSRVLTNAVIRSLWKTSGNKAQEFKVSLSPKTQLGNNLSLEVLLGSGVDGQVAC